MNKKLEKSYASFLERSKTRLRSFDRNNLPAHRILQKLVQSEPNKKLLILCEIVIGSGLAASFYFYFR